MIKPLYTNRHYAGPQHVGDEILCVNRLSYTYPDGTNVLCDVSFHAQQGSTLAIVGPNGAGKTTLLKILVGLIDGYEGSVEIAGLPPHEARRRGNLVSWVPQRARMTWDFPLTVKQVVRMGLVGKTGLLRKHRREDLDFVDHLMDILNLQHLAGKAIGEISGGQQQRAIIARALAPQPKLLLLDEPTVGVDQAGLEAFADLMTHIKQDFGVTLALVSHDLRTVLPECEQVACLNKRLHFHDAPSKLTPEMLSEVFQCKLTGMQTTHKHNSEEDAQ